MENIRSKWPKLDILFENVESIFKSRPGPKYQENKAEASHYFPGFILVSPNFTLVGARFLSKASLSS